MTDIEALIDGHDLPEEYIVTMTVLDIWGDWMEETALCKTLTQWFIPEEVQAIVSDCVFYGIVERSQTGRNPSKVALSELGREILPR